MIEGSSLKYSLSTEKKRIQKEIEKEQEDAKEQPEKEG